MKTNKCFQKILFKFFLFSILITNPISATAEWTTLVFIQARNNLNKFASKNINDMAMVGSNKNLNILVQLYQPNNRGVWRYKINKNKLELDSFLKSNTDGTNTSDLVGAMKWATSKYPAKKYSLVLWNHGVGILDPNWNGSHRIFSSKLITDDQNLQTEYLKTTNENKMEQEKMHHRGILFNEQSKTYMNNQQLVEALKQIKNNVLKNKKIDIFGMDACLMAMLEVGYQSRNYAKYMVASQEVELAYGWPYIQIMNQLSLGNMSPIKLAESIVLFYRQYYKNKIPFFTQSAVNLENIIHVKNNVDQVVALVNNCKKQDKNAIKNLIKNARKHSIQFSTKFYVDLHSFYFQLSQQLKQHYFNKNSKQKNHFLLKNVSNLKKALKIGMKLIENAVIASTAGKKLKSAKGISIYFPLKGIDKSYYKTEFAQNSLWIDLLKFSQEK